MMPMTAQCGIGVDTSLALRIWVFVRDSPARLEHVAMGEIAEAVATTHSRPAPSRAAFLQANTMLCIDCLQEPWPSGPGRSGNLPGICAWAYGTSRTCHRLGTPDRSRACPSKEQRWTLAFGKRR